ncbi:hypothetical protein [Streptomyces mirabilis]|uniref:hypothetical protein n=1 Tax=Streptomyces mirabilis TaxID=68239 RepID=UPI0035DC6610
MSTGIPTTAAASVGVSPAPAAVAQALAAVHATVRLEIDIRWLLDRQEELLGKNSPYGTTRHWWPPSHDTG